MSFLDLVRILLTAILVIDCLFLVFLVLMQLPKKEAGAGLAFGGSASDALFGAGSGNVLTKLTKYAATLFLGLALVLSFLNTRQLEQGDRRLGRELEKRSQVPAGGIPLPRETNAELPRSISPVTNTLLLTPTNTAPAAGAPAVPPTQPQNKAATPVAPPP